MAPTLDHLLKKWFKVLWSIYEISLLTSRWLRPMSDGVFEFWSDQYIYIYIYIYSPERGGLVVGICELALRTLIRVRASTWEECGDLCWGAPDYQLSWSVRVRFVVISNHCSYGSIQYSLTGGAPMVTSRGRVTMVAPALFFIQPYIYIYIYIYIY